MRQKTLILSYLAWALLIPLVYLGPTSLARYAEGARLVVFVSTGFALLVIGLCTKTRMLERVDRISGPAIPALLALVIVAYVAISFSVNYRNFSSFSPHLPQVGLFSQSVWTTLHGHLFSNSHETINGTLATHFGIHFSPSLLLLIPFYAIWPSPLMLLLLKAMVVALTILPFYYLCKCSGSSSAAFVCALGLLLLPAMAWDGCNDFNDTAFIPVLLMTALLGIETKRWGMFTIAAIAALGVREDVGLTIAALGAYTGLRGFGWKKAAMVSALGLIWYFGAVLWVIPRFSSTSLWVDPKRIYAMHFGQWGETPIDAISNILSHPVAFLRQAFTRNKLHYLYALFQPTLFFPMLGSPAWIVGLPILAANFLTGAPTVRQLTRNYSIIPIIFAYLGVVQTAMKLAGAKGQENRKASELAAALIVLAAIVPSLLLTPPLPVTRLSPPEQEARAILKMIPPGDPVYVPLALYPHLCNRLYAGCWESLRERGREYEIRGRYRWIVIWPEGDPPNENRDTELGKILASDPRYERIEGYYPFVVYKRRAEND